MVRRNDTGMMSDAVFWQAATVSVALATTAAVLLFALVAGVADGVAPALDLSRHWVYAAVVVISAAAGALLARRRTPRAVGAAMGTSTAGLLVALVRLATA
ncbi:hypothetical protein [Nocardia blacklockiae]|uniref:hypothetical protein n=1 Tax=Nocardia blacklockiae TaxID=480036 RepID=UPI0018957638|nr:hypothetical protein [Nocardia blacklockiae]MBF6173830.1 hypothetical protein [Nocardia blacklockiae]